MRSIYNTGVCLNGLMSINRTSFDLSDNSELSDNVDYTARFINYKNPLPYGCFFPHQTHQDKRYKRNHVLNKDNNDTNDNLVLGDTQEWKKIIDIIRKQTKPTEPEAQVECDMGEWSQHDLEQIKRTSFPLHCESGSTFSEIALHGLIRQRLKPNTVEKHLRYARFMENHEVPVDFKNISFKNFMRHMDYREQTGATPSALRHEWDAMKMFLEAYGLSYGQGTNWHYKPPSKKNSHKPRILPPPAIAHQFMHTKYSTNPYENALYQYIFSLGFLIGFRVPSEIVSMTTDDVIINPDGTGCIIITEQKKDDNQRTVYPRQQILASKQQKSFHNWITYWRPKVANEYSGNALFLWPSGKPVTTRRLGHKLSQYGKQIWPHFQPYDLRRWCAVARLIETKVETGSYDEYEVYDWLGHTDIATTMIYVKQAKKYYRQYPYNWIQRVLRCSGNFFNQLSTQTPNNTLARAEENSLKSTKHQKTLLSHGTNRDNEKWGHWDLLGPTDRELTNRFPFSSLLENLSHFLNLMCMTSYTYLFFYHKEKYEFSYKHDLNRLRNKKLCMSLIIVRKKGVNELEEEASLASNPFRSGKRLLIHPYGIHNQKTHDIATLVICFYESRGIYNQSCGCKGYEGRFSFISIFVNSRVATTKGSEKRYEWREKRGLSENKVLICSCCQNRYGHH